MCSLTSSPFDLQEGRSRSPRRASAVHEHCELLILWLLDWAWGSLPAVQVQRYAAAATKSKFPVAHILEKVARIGNSGAKALLPYPHSSLAHWLGVPLVCVPNDMLNIAVAGASSQNCHRALMAMFVKDCGELITPIPDSAASSIILPHDLFSWLYEHALDNFNSRMGVDGLAQFWESLAQSVRGRELVSGNQHLQSDLSKVVPIVLHADAGPFSRRLSVKLVQWSSVTGCGAANRKQFLACSWIPKIHTGPNQAWKVLLWSFEQLAIGRHPDTDWNGNPFMNGSRQSLLAGKPLAAGFKGVCIFVKGDMEFYARDLRLMDYSANRRCCFSCPADRNAEVPMMHFSSTAAWRSMVFSNEEYLERHREAHPLCSMVGFCRSTVVYDTMHIIDHHGVASQAIASALVMMVRNRELCQTKEGSLAVINARLRAFYSANNVANRLPDISWNMLVADWCPSPCDAPESHVSRSQTLVKHAPQMNSRDCLCLPRTKGPFHLCMGPWSKQRKPGQSFRLWRSCVWISMITP